MYNYDQERLSAVFKTVLLANTEPAVYDWLQEKSLAKGADFNAAFMQVPRRTRRSPATVPDEIHQEMTFFKPGFSIRGWTIDRVARVWLLMNMLPAEHPVYFRNIENLFLSGEMNELVALYSALPLFAFPDDWRARCSEGIRSNISSVLDAVICYNPYPAAYLPEPAWNQLVLKAFFTEKPVSAIVGLDERRNRALAFTLADYAHERWAAGRKVNPELWRCVGPFIDEALLPDLQKLTVSKEQIDREAGALACHESPYLPAKEIIPSELARAIGAGTLNWKMIAQKNTDYVLQS